MTGRGTQGIVIPSGETEAGHPEEELADAFCKACPRHRALAPKARRVLDMLVGSGEPLRGKPGGWAGGIVHALTYTGCGVPGVLNADLEKAFDASIGTIRKRAARIERLFDIRP